MKFSYNKSKKLLTNKYFLYFVLLLSFFYLLYLLLERRINLIIVFALISCIIYSFNKNMIVVLGISLIITFISTLGIKVKEGLENNSDNTDPNTDPNTSTQQPSNKDSKSKNVTSQSNQNGEGPSSTSIDMTNSDSTIPEASTTTEPMDSMSRKRNRLDENAASVNDTYSDLNNILGNGSGSNLNMDTKQLLEQQAQLSEAMKNMGPLIESAKTLMNGINFDGINNLASSLVSKK